MKKRVFVFKEVSEPHVRPMLYAFPEDKIVSVITGFVVTDAYGNIGIVDKSVVRWISKEQWSQL